MKIELLSFLKVIAKFISGLIVEYLNFSKLICMTDLVTKIGYCKMTPETIPSLEERIDPCPR